MSKELSEISIRKLTHAISKDGNPYAAKHPVGGVKCLYLQCNLPKGSAKAGTKQWLYRATIGQERPWLGLGGYPSVPTKTAREEARRLRALIKDGIDPRIEKRKLQAQLEAEQRKELSIKQAVAKFVIKKQAEFKTAKQVTTLRKRFDKYVIPFIGNVQVKDIEQHHLIPMIEASYYKHTDVTIRMVNKTEEIIQQAIIEGIRTTPNPAKWSGNLALLFPAREKIAPTKHHPFLPWEQLPEFMEALDAYKKLKGGKSEVDCLAFIIHTVARVSEARLMKWSDVDLEKKIWTIQPAAVKGDDMRKSSKMWKIPLTTPAIKILKEQPSYAEQSGLIFLNVNKEEIDGSYFGSNINSALGFEGDTHGFRTTFKMWCQEHGINDEVSELCMKHTSSDATRAAYARSQLFDYRKGVLTAFSKYATTGQSIPKANVIPIRKRAS